jgi:dTDP-4-amino-4,6-dideoxygalactose transaminase
MMLHPQKLAPPHRLDFTGPDLVAAVGTLRARDEARARDVLERAWGGPAFLSVRSGLSALLQSVSWPRGSEVLVSALTISDMPKLIVAHGFVPVAVEVDAATLAPSLTDLRAKVTGKTRAILVAHLFGSRIDLSPIAHLAREHELMLLEDCAQAFVGPSYRGHADSDVAMFSFGTLKTMTALGGALFTVNDPLLRRRMAEVEARWPKQTTSAFAKKIAKTAAFLLAQNASVYGFIAWAAALGGTSVGALLRKATRGFPARTIDELLAKLHLRPCASLLALLELRLRSFDGARLRERALAGERLAARWQRGGVVIGGAAGLRTHWIFAVRTKNVEALRRALWRAGIDASAASNIAAVGGKSSQRLVNELVFVPAYPELATAAVHRLIHAIDCVAQPIDAPMSLDVAPAE